MTILSTLYLERESKSSWRVCPSYTTVARVPLTLKRRQAVQTLFVKQSRRSLPLTPALGVEKARLCPGDAGVHMCTAMGDGI